MLLEPVLPGSVSPGGVLLDGVHVPLTVPFYADGESYLRKVEHNVRRYSLSPIAGVVALLPGSEAEGLSDAEQVATLRTVAEAARPEKVLVAGVRRESVRSALGLIREAHAAEFDAVLLAAPLLSARLRGAQETSGELSLFFQVVADQSALPVILWSEARAPGVALTRELVVFLAQHPNVIGLYDADLTAGRFVELRERTAAITRQVTVTPVFAPVTRRMLTVKEPGAGGSFVPAIQLAGGGLSVAVAPPLPSLRTRTRQVSFQIMAAGPVRGAASLLQSGVPGMLPTLAACAPQGCHEVYAAFKDGNEALAVEKEERLWEADALLAEMGPSGLKYASDLNGFYGGIPRLPFLPSTADERTSVERAMRFVRQ